MAKLRPNKITEHDIAEYLATADDFAFETAVFKACVDAGLQAEHAGTYQDPVTKKDRQFDIRAIVRKENLTVRFAIECKNLRKNYPLVVSRVPLDFRENYHEIIISGDRESDLLLSATVEPTDTIRLGATYSMHSRETHVGKSTTQVGRSQGNQELVAGDSEVFEKWSQAVASAIGQVSEASDDFKASRSEIGATIVLPILVVPDGTLWVADYSREGVLAGQPKQVDSCLVYLGKEVAWQLFLPSYTFSHLQVFTENEFTKYLKNFGSSEDYWDILFCDTKLNPAYLAFEVRYK